MNNEMTLDKAVKLSDEELDTVSGGREAERTRRRREGPNDDYKTAQRFIIQLWPDGYHKGATEAPYDPNRMG